MFSSFNSMFGSSEAEKEIPINAPIGDFLATANEKSVKGETVLHKAVRKNNLDLVKTLVAATSQVNINLADDAGNTALHQSCLRKTKDAIEYVKELCSSTKINVNLQNLAGETPLHFAVQTGNVEVVKYLLLTCKALSLATKPKGINLKGGQSNKGLSHPLHYAFLSQTLSAEIIEALLEAFPNAKIINEAELTPLMLAFSHADVRSLSLELLKKLMLASDIDARTKHQQTFIHLMAENNNLKADLFEQILGFVNPTYFAKIINTQDGNNQTAFFSAIKNANKDKASFLLNTCKANPNIGNGNTYPLLLAIEKKMGIALTLVENGADVNVEDSVKKTALVYAAEFGNEQVIAALKNRGVNFSGSKGDLAVTVALRNKHINVVKQLISYGAKGDQALLYAAEHGHEDIIDELIKNNFKFSEPIGDIAVKKALLNNHINILTKIISNGANPDVHVDLSDHDSKISYGSSFSSYGRRDQDKTGVLKDGDTPLHFAVKTENVALATACLENQPGRVNVVNVNSVNSNGQTPAHMAIKVLSPQMANLLKTHGAELDLSIEIQAGKNKRTNSLFSQASGRQFGDDKQLKEFFVNEDYQLTEKQEVLRKKALVKYQPNMFQPVQKSNVTGSVAKSEVNVTSYKK